jgi:glutamine transport system permease protein
MRRVWKWCVAGVMALMLAVVLGSPVSTQAAEKTYVIGTDVTYAPFEFADKNNQYVGIDIDLMQAIAKAEGFKVDIKPLGFNAAVQALEANQIDGVIAGMQITPERQQKFAMSDPYYKTAVAMAVGQNSEVKSLKDLRGKRVALKTGTAAADYALSLKAKYGFTTVTFDDSNNMYQDVITGNSVACFDDKPVLQYAIATGLKLKLAGPESKASYYGFATQKDRSDHLDQRFNAGLKKVKADGTYAKIVAKYLGNGTQAAQKQTSAKTQDSDRSFLGLLRENWGTLMGGLKETMIVTIVAIFFATVVGILWACLAFCQISLLAV